MATLQAIPEIPFWGLYLELGHCVDPQCHLLAHKESACRLAPRSWSIGERGFGWDQRVRGGPTLMPGAGHSGELVQKHIRYNPDLPLIPLYSFLLCHGPKAGNRMAGRANTGRALDSLWMLPCRLPSCQISPGVPLASVPLASTLGQETGSPGHS